MTRDEIIEAGAKALCSLAGYVWERLGDEPNPIWTHEFCHNGFREQAAAMLDAITEGMGLKLIGREPIEKMKKASSRGDFNRAVFYFRRMWDAAPWVPGGEKP